MSKITRALKKCLPIFSVLILSMFAVYSLISSFDVPPQNKIQLNNYTDFYPTTYKKAIKKSRESAVKVISFSHDSVMMSSASGTYFVAFGNYFVVTVAHGILSPCEFTKLVHEEEIYECVKYVALDLANDYAIIQTTKIEDRTPIRIPNDLPKNKQWIESYSIMNKLIYTGFPNTIGPLTITGNVAGFGGSEYLYIISYAWQGSSGSGVFDKNGKYIGYVVAIDVGQTEFGIQVLENLVLVAPAFKVDWSKTITEAH